MCKSALSSGAVLTAVFQLQQTWWRSVQVTTMANLPVSAEELEMPREEVKRLLSPLGIITKMLLHIADQLVVDANSAIHTSNSRHCF